MRNCSSFFVLVFLVSSASMQVLMAQDEPKPDRNFKNTIRVNITNPLIFGERSLVLGFERMLKDYQSFSINAGLGEFPEFDLFNPGDSSVLLTKNSKGSGSNLTGDYRFYIMKENKFAAPRGVYIGPYATFSSMSRKNNWQLDTDNFMGEVITNFKLNYIGLGIELGYQFVFWERLALDLVMIGPGLAFYKLHASLDTTLEPEDESELYERLSDALNEKFPGFDFVIDDIDFRETGSSNTTGLGYRYVVHLGYRF